MIEPPESQSEASDTPEGVEEPSGSEPLQDTAALPADGKAKTRLNQKLRRVLVCLCAAFAVCFAGLMVLLHSDREPDYGLGRLEVTANCPLPAYGGEVDLSGREVEPSARDLSSRWDSSLFYWLEETDAGSEEDGNISRCEQFRFQAVRSDTGNPIDYEVYRDAATGEVYKIVSIEHTPSGLELTDYYYQQGKLNFVFRRADSIYTPTYASIDKVGERFSFNQDQMTRWRFIEHPQVVKQWILAPEDSPYQQWGYGSLTDEERSQYDEKEREILNDGYHTYQIVMEHRPAQILAGRVVDGEGRPVSGAWVGVCRAGEDKAFVKLETDAQGQYAWEVDGKGQAYQLVAQKKGYRTITMEPDADGMSMALFTQEDMILLEKGGKRGTVDLQVYAIEAPAEPDASVQEEPEDIGMPALEGVRAVFRKGMRRMEGEEAGSFTTDPSGRIQAKLPQGVYTVELQKEGYETSWITIAAGTGRAESAYCVPSQGEPPVWSIVLTWDLADGQPLDLDSCVFTPRQSLAGNMEYVSPINQDDGRGTRFLYDGKGNTACEVIQIESPQQGAYKYYVSDYQKTTDQQPADRQAAGQQAAVGEDAAQDGRMAASGATVSVYKDGTLVRVFHIPSGQQGAIWEVFEIQNGTVVPIQRLYAGAEGKGWWIQDKSKARLRRLAMEAYRAYLETNTEVVDTAMGTASKITDFAVLDMDGDSVEELLAKVQEVDADGLYNDSGVEVFSYQPGASNLLMQHQFECEDGGNPYLIGGDEWGLMIDGSQKQVFTRGVPWNAGSYDNESVAGFQYEGDGRWGRLSDRENDTYEFVFDSSPDGGYLPERGLLSYGDTYSDTYDQQAEWEAYIQFCETYLHTDQRVDFVKNTAANQEMYLGQGIPTGLSQIKECDDLGRKLPGVQGYGKLSAEEAGWQEYMDGSQQERYYLYPDGSMACDTWMEDSYYVDAYGKMVHDAWKDVDGTSYYFGSDGAKEKVMDYAQFIGVYEFRADLHNLSNTAANPDMLNIMKIKDGKVYGNFRYERLSYTVIGDFRDGTPMVDNTFTFETVVRSYMDDGSFEEYGPTSDGSLRFGMVDGNVCILREPFQEDEYGEIGGFVKVSGYDEWLSGEEALQFPEWN